MGVNNYDSAYLDRLIGQADALIADYEREREAVTEEYKKARDETFKLKRDLMAKAKDYKHFLESIVKRSAADRLKGSKRSSLTAVPPLSKIEIPDLPSVAEFKRLNDYEGVHKDYVELALDDQNMLENLAFHMDERHQENIKRAMVGAPILPVIPQKEKEMDEPTPAQAATGYWDGEAKKRKSSRKSRRKSVKQGRKSTKKGRKSAKKGRKSAKKPCRSNKTGRFTKRC